MWNSAGSHHALDHLPGCGDTTDALRLRIAPEIAFKLDQSVAHAARIETLLAQLHDERTADATPENDERPPAGGGPSD